MGSTSVDYRWTSRRLRVEARMDQDSGTRFARPVDRYVSRGALERGGRRVAGRARSLVTAQRSSPRQPVFRDLRQTFWQERAKFQVPKFQVSSSVRELETRNLKLLLVDAYAQSRRLQPVLRASETAAPPASVPKAPPAEGVSVLSDSPQRHGEPVDKLGQIRNLGSGLEADLLTGPSWLLI